MQPLRKATWFAAVLGFVVAAPVAADDLEIQQDGRVTIELIGSGIALFHNTLAVESPAVGVARRGCKVETPVTGLPGTAVLSEKPSQHGCRVRLDSDPSTSPIDEFDAGTVFEFNLCAQTDDDAECEFVWSSDPGDNSDGFDHVKITELYPVSYPGRVYRLDWEDLENGGDKDFDDLIAVVRVELDSDGDGLWDDWEAFGVDTDGDGTLDLDLPALGADPMRKDLFLEIDFMDCSVAGSDCSDAHSHQPLAAAITNVETAFAQAPVSNPDGSTGIVAHLEVDDAIPHNQFMALDDVANRACGAPTCLDSSSGVNPCSFDAAKKANFEDSRRFAFRYAIFAHRQHAGTCSSGCGEGPGNDFLVTLGDTGCGWVGGIGSQRQQAGTLLHELGHNLGLGHGGGDSDNYKPNYLSVMNYRFQIDGIPSSSRLDYSRSDLPDLDETDLDETVGLCTRVPAGGLDCDAGTLDTLYNCPGMPFGTQMWGDGFGPIDWNCVGGATDGDATDPGSSMVQVNVNRDCVDSDGSKRCETGEPAVFSTLKGFDDWENIQLPFQDADDFEDGDHSSTFDLREAEPEDVIFPVADAGAVADGDRATPPGPPFEPYACVLGETVSLDGSGSINPLGDLVLFEWDFPAGGSVDATGPFPIFDCSFNVGEVAVILTVTDELERSVSDATTVQIGLDAGPDQVVECGGAVTLGAGLPRSSTLGYEWTLEDGTVLGTRPEITVELPLGSHVVALTVTDDRGVSVSDDIVVTVEDTTTPELSVSASPGVLWPPDHELRAVDLEVVAQDVCDSDPQVVLAAVTSSEPDDAPGGGDGRTTGDVQDADVDSPDFEISLRAERQGRGPGRQYTIVYRVTDGSGNGAEAATTVLVPHDQRH